MLKLVVSGAAGQMGRAIIALLEQEDEMTLGAALEKKGYVGTTDRDPVRSVRSFSILDQPKKAVQKGDVIVDFTHPTCTGPLLQEALKGGKPMVIGTTGFSEPAREKIRKAALKIPIVFSPNMSIGMNVMFKLVADAAAVLGDAYDAEIVEMHHHRKQDAPSGTALRLGEAIAFARGTRLSRVGRFTRQGMVGARPQGEIGIQSLRAGDVVGQHTVVFAGSGERIELVHHAHSRDNFARGALLAAQWVVHQKPGLYTMMDVLDLRT